MSAEIVTGIFGLLGALVGSGITIIYQTMSTRKTEKKDNKLNVVRRIRELSNEIENIDCIINKILDFIEADFTDKENRLENSEIYNSITNIYSESFVYFWDGLKVEIYMFFNKTASNKLFRNLDNVMQETLTMSTDIVDFLSDGSDITELQERFKEFKNMYIKAKYMNYKFNDEFKEIITGKRSSDKQRTIEYYKNYKKEIKSIN